jgi:hypothetical protein
MKLSILFAVILNMTFVLDSTGQQKDFVGLTGIKIEKKISRSFDVGISHQSMFNQNLAERWMSFEDLSLGFRINRHWSTELHYRYIRFRNRDNFYDTRQLFYHTITYSHSWKKFSISIRNRFQKLSFSEPFDEGFRPSRWYNRDKLTMRYRINYYWSPFLAYETFIPISNPERKKMDQWRGSAGITRSFNDRLRMDLYYQIQQQINRPPPKTFFLVGVNFYYQI